jgi:hypothetical protein
VAKKLEQRNHSVTHFNNITHKRWRVSFFSIIPVINWMIDNPLGAQQVCKKYSDVFRPEHFALNNADILLTNISTSYFSTPHANYSGTNSNSYTAERHTVCLYCREYRNRIYRLCVSGRLSPVGDHILQEFNTLYLTRFRTYQIGRPHQAKT